jgi:hypothetical protein
MMINFLLPAKKGRASSRRFPVEARKGKFKKISSGGLITQDGKKKKDMSKVKCFACHKFGNYVGKCTYKKKVGSKTQSKVVA